MVVSLRTTGGIYDVHSSSGNTYRVDIAARTCTCPDWQADGYEGDCKHIHRVRLELKRGAIPTPDGKLPTRPQPTAQSDERGVVDTESTGGTADDATTGPHREIDRYGRATGATYYRCERCGAESIREEDIEEHDCRSRMGKH